MVVKRFKVTDSSGSVVCFARGEVDDDGNLVRLFDMAFQRKELIARLSSKGSKWFEHVKKYYHYYQEGKFTSSVLRELCTWWNDCANMLSSTNNKRVEWKLVYEYLLTSHAMKSDYVEGALESFRKVCEREDRTLSQSDMALALFGKL